MNFKSIIKFSLIYILLTSFLEKFCYLIFNIQNIQEIGFAQILFNPFVFSLVYIIILILLINSITKKQVFSFKEILTSIISLMVFNYCFQYINDLMFYYLNNIIHSPVQSDKEGLLYLVEVMSKTFGVPTFSILNELLLNPFFLLLDSIKTFNLKMFYLTILNSQIILSAIVIFYYSLYSLFKALNRKGIDAIIPIKNNLTLLSITDKPIWWIFPLLIPIIRYIPKYFINLKLAQIINRKSSFAIGMTFIPWLLYGMITLNKNTVANTVYKK